MPLKSPTEQEHQNSDIRSHCCFHADWDKESPAEDSLFHWAHGSFSNSWPKYFIEKGSVDNGLF
jgi:hypothetical protein